MVKSSTPGSNWAKLQELASASPTASSSRKGKEPVRGTAPARSKSRASGIAAYAHRSQDFEPGPSTVKVDVPVPAPSITEGVVFKPLAEPTAAQIELREMVAGRTPMNDARRAPGNYIAIDCEMVGLGHMGSESALARVSLVNYHGHIILDTFVEPRERVTDWRTWVSGVREEDLLGAPTFQEVQKKVAGIVEGRILVGHAIENDLKVLLLNHPGPMVRDTQKCKALRERAKNKRPGLKKLVEMELGLEIQKGAHSSVTDARATMALYRLHKVEWEKQLRPATEAFKIKTSKRKRDTKTDNDGEEGEDGETGQAEKEGRKRSKEEFPGGGRKGVSTGLGKIVKRNGVRVDHRTGKVLDGKNGRDAQDATGESSSGNWWEEDA